MHLVINKNNNKDPQTSLSPSHKICQRQSGKC